MSNPLILLSVIFMGLVGGLSSLYLLISIPVILIWKFLRKIRYGYKMTD